MATVECNEGVEEAGPANEVNIHLNEQALKMKKATRTFACLALIAAVQIVYGQSKKADALAKGNQAVKLEDEGKYEEALKLLDEAQKLDPDNYNYPYEISYAYYLQKNYTKAIEECKRVIQYKNSDAQCYQLLGGIYDDMGDSVNAIKAYDDGLKIFPKSGRLYLEKGNLYWNKEEYNKALPFYEQGIEADPGYPSNYYRAAKLYCASGERVWGMIYGELFMNLERGSKRTQEISKLLFNTYKSGIEFTSDTSLNISFSKNSTIDVGDLKDPKKLKLPFGIGLYEPLIGMSIVTEKNIDINSLDRIRTNFVEAYFKNGNNKKYPNVLFDYQNEVLKAGHLEAYNHWILMKGDEEGFDKWISANKDKYDSFVTWFSKNQITIDGNHKFYSWQYQEK